MELSSFRITRKGIRVILILLIVAGLVGLGWVTYPRWQPVVNAWLAGRGITLPGGGSEPVVSAATPQPPQAAAFTATASPTLPEPTSPAPPVDFANPQVARENLRQQGVLVFAMRDGEYIHLFAYHPLYLPFSRLTNNPWDDITPALSPDGLRLAYSSRQNGYWDLYILDLSTGNKTRVTDTPDYEASPSWSPDGQWIAYERYNGVSLDVYIQSLVDPTSDPIQLTDDPGIDRSPAWSPQGREIAFVSSRTGDEEIWLARLDNVDDRFANLSRTPLSRDLYPVWSADGRRLAWSAQQDSSRRLVVWDQEHPDVLAKVAGEGDRAAWTPDGRELVTEIRDANQTGIAAYAADTARLSQAFLPLPGALYGFTWVGGPLPEWFEGTLNNPDTIPVPTLWQPVITRTVIPAGRAGLVQLADVSAPQPMLQDAVDEAFTALRQQVAEESGWDVFSSLENAYLPLTSPPTPSLYNDWLYTGRAISANSLLLSAGWMSITREDFAGQTYWHVYLKARYQDGSMGAPLSDMAWDLNARFSGDPQAYEQGGKLGQVPPGYWIDLTEIASRYSWERLPSWINWRTFYASIRFNQFVITDGLEWRQAMAELYPQEALATTTPIPTYTPPSLATSAAARPAVTETPTALPTPAATRRPTWTPLPGQTIP